MDKYIQVNKGDCGIGTPCLICGDTVKIKHYGDTPKICNKCKTAAIARRRTEEKRVAEYIEQDVFIAELNREIDDEEALYDAIERSDEDDMVKVVRCKDCIHHDDMPCWCNMIDAVMYRNDFCNYGERREENEIE